MKHYFKYVLLFQFGLLIPACLFTQDTIKIDKQINYYAETDTLDILSHNRKNIYNRAQYARELIKYCKDSVKLEFCFYYDNKRYTHFYDKLVFKTDKDSIISITYGSLKESWIYKKQNDTCYFLRSADSNYEETGFAKRLVPLEKTGDFVMKNNNGDTLWTTEYIRNYYPEIKPYMNLEFDTVYEYTQLLNPPVLISGDSMYAKTISINAVNKPIWESSIFCRLVLIKFIVDDKGNKKNIEIVRSCGDAYFEKAALQELIKLGQFKPGMVDGNSVNTKMIFLVKFKL